MQRSAKQATHLPPKAFRRIGRLLVSAVAGASLFATTYLGQEAKACDCVTRNLAQHFSTSDHVFSGKILFNLDLPNRSLFLAAVETNYTGCEAEQGLVWLQSPNDGASCGTSFSVGESYLLFANDVPGVYGFALDTGDCSGNRRLSDLKPEDLAYLQTRQNCCGGSCTCQPGVDEVNCVLDPCSVAAPCQGAGVVRCESNYCGGCHAEFYDSDGARVCVGQEQTPCWGDTDCAEGEYCNGQRVCADDGTCESSENCLLDGNDFAVNLDCAPDIRCEEGLCVADCKDERCVDHKGYDFGDCDGYLGWLMLDGACVEVSSGCGSLVPNTMTVFESKEECESACNQRANNFKCGGRLKCDKTKSYCEESLPGAEPPPGTPIVNFACRPLPEACAEAPSCAACFEVAEGFQVLIPPGGYPADCTDDGQGEMYLNVAYP